MNDSGDRADTDAHDTLDDAVERADRRATWAVLLGRILLVVGIVVGLGVLSLRHDLPSIFPI